MKKLRSRRGETLTETLVAILIIALSAAVLATMTATAVRLDRTADAATEAYFDDLSAAEAASADPVDGHVRLDGEIHVDDRGTHDIKIAGGSGALISWKGAGA